MIKTIIIWLIDFYKYYISNQKGFACAHRVLHQEVSCSTYIKNYIQQNGLTNLTIVINSRANSCKNAALILGRKKYKPEHSHRKKKKNSTCDDVGCFLEGLGDIASCLD